MAASELPPTKYEGCSPTCGPGRSDPRYKPLAFLLSQQNKAGFPEHQEEYPLRRGIFGLV